MARNTINIYAVSISVLALFTIFYITRTSFNCDQNKGESYNIADSSGDTQLQDTDYERIHKVVVSDDGGIKIAVVICSKPGDNGPRGEVAVLIKSVVMSIIMYNISQKVTFILFLEHESDQNYFNSKLEEYGSSQVDIEYHPVQNILKNHYHSFMAKEERLRCMYVRVYFPTVLDELDSVIYVDTDIIITGNLAVLWSYFAKMNSEQVVGVVPDFEKENPLKSRLLNDVPFPPPKGINSGLQLMNLTKMRRYNWVSKMLRLYEDYAIRQNVTMRSDQKLLNILLYFDPGLMLSLPCQFNFWWTHCYYDSKLYCRGAERDPDGIQVVHGAASGYDKGRPFREIYQPFRDFSLDSETTAEQIKNDLMTQIRAYYSGKGKGKFNHKRCDKSIEKLLFKYHFREN